MLALGVPDKYAMSRMGHATPTMLKTVYQHLQINKNIIILLTDLHTELLKSSKHPFYSAAYYKVLPFIVEIRNKSNGTDKPEIENCFDTIYGFTTLRMQQKEVSYETVNAVREITKFLGLLADYYKKDKNAELEF
jgi:hypothetical protein